MSAALASACGKKGPPLAPLNLIPEPPSGVAATRVAATVYLEMTAPAKNANGPGLPALDHVEIYAVTVGTGFATPPNRELLTPTYLVGRVDIKPPPDEEQPVDEEEEKKDTRPAPGQRVTFVEEITDKQLQSAAGLKPLPPPGAVPATASTATSSTETPSTTTTTPPTTSTPAATPPDVTPPPSATPPSTMPPAATLPGSTPPLTTPTPAPTTPASEGTPPAANAEKPVTAPAAPSGPVRIYLARGVTRKGRPGPPSARVTIPLVPPPPPPGLPSATFSERAVTVSWLAPVGTVGEAPAVSFNVYAIPSATAKPAAGLGARTVPAPLNPAPISERTFERPGAQPGVEQCFEIRTVETLKDVRLESEPTPRVCVTPKDIFPPAAPKGLAVVAMDGAVMNLIWDPNAEPDLAGYLVLRGEAPGDTLQPLTPEPINDTKFTDTTVKAGVRYVYAIVAVDKATPPNRSAPSARIEETAR